MTAIRILAPSLLAVAFVSCASQNADQYDTTNAYSTPDAPPPQPATNTATTDPVYDTPPAYEESTATPASAAAAASIADASAAPARHSSSATTPAKPVPTNPAHAKEAPSKHTASAASAPTPASGGSATTHTVVKGDTLSRISKKYKVSIDSIKKANHMTSDTVVLGRKMVIPPH